jgi:alpha-N-acetylglucosaminidase
VEETWWSYNNMTGCCLTTSHAPCIPLAKASRARPILGDLLVATAALAISVVVFGGTAAAAVAAGRADDVDPQVGAVRSLLRRQLLPAHERLISLELLPIPPGQTHVQHFRVRPSDVDGCVVHLAGTSGVALASALNRYLKYDAQVQIGVWWTKQTASLREDARLPPPTPFNGTSPYVFNNYLNICAFGYSTAWWDWRRWEEEIDWMALNGVINPLAMVGQDALWLDTFTKDFGLDKAALLTEFFAGPTFQPWHWMGNLNGWGGPVDEAFLRQQLQLQRQITDRMVQFGMRPVLPGFAGHVPAQMQRRFPHANITQLAPWHAHFTDGTYFLSPATSNYSATLFNAVAAKFMRRQAAALGVQKWSRPHYFLADAYNEMPPTSTDPAFLASVSTHMYDSMAAVDKDTVLVMQGWFLRNVPAHPWGTEQATAFLHGPPHGKLLILDLEAVKNPVWARTHSFYGVPFAFCMLHNYGERPGLFGRLNTIALAMPAALNNSLIGTMIGTGMTPEGLGTNPIVYDLFAEMFWRGHKAPDLDKWIQNFYRRRYGLNSSSDGYIDKHAKTAWHLLQHSVYSAPVEAIGGNASSWKWGDGPHASDMAARPALNGGRIPDTVEQAFYNMSAVQHAWVELLACIYNNDTVARVGPSRQWLSDDVQGFSYDLVAVGRQVISDRFNSVRAELHNAAVALDIAEVTRCGDVLLEMIDDMDKLLGSHQAFLLGSWLSNAESWAAQASTSGFGEKLMEDARRVITLWGHPSSRNDTVDSRLSQYSYRLWAGLVRGFYRPRWERFINAVLSTIKSGHEFDSTQQARVAQQILWWEERWVTNVSNVASKFGKIPRGSTTAISWSLCVKYVAGCGLPKATSVPVSQSPWLPVSVTVGSAASASHRSVVSPVFVGLSTETYDAVKMYGSAANSRQSVAQALLNFKDLTPGVHEGPVIRVGGDSADSSCWKTVSDNNCSCKHCPGQKDCINVRCCSYNITITDLDAYAAFAGVPEIALQHDQYSAFAQLNASFVITLNLGYGPDPARAAAEAGAILRHRVLRKLQALELGNEPASFHDGHRARSYNFLNYSDDIQQYLGSIHALNSHLPPMEQLSKRFLQAAVFAHPYDWSRDPSLSMSAFLLRYSLETFSLCVHSYALTGVERKAGNISRRTLLSPYCSKYHASTYAKLAADARAAGVQFVIGEGNSVSEGGQTNISDVYTSALWVVDFLCEIAKVGAARFNVHGGVSNRSKYAAIVIENPDDPYSRVLIRPLYYGLFAFSEFVANYSTWLSTSYECAPPTTGVHESLLSHSDANCSNVAVHANVDKYGRVKVLVVSKELQSHDCVTGPTVSICKIVFNVRLKGFGQSHASWGVIKLLSTKGNSPLEKSLSKHGICWGELTFDDTSNGKPRLINASRSMSLQTARGSVSGNDLLFRLEVPQLSAALLTVAPLGMPVPGSKTDDADAHVHLTMPTLHPLKMRPLGAYCGAHHGSPHTNASGCLETAPIMWNGELVMVEHHQHFRVRRQAYTALNQTSNEALISGVPGSENIAYVSAIVVKNESVAPAMLVLFGTNNVKMFGGKPRTQVHIFWSSDPTLSATSWKSQMILQLPQSGDGPLPGHKAYDVPWWTAFNTSPTKAIFNGSTAFVLAIELGSPQSVIGPYTELPYHHRFSTVFAVCFDCVRTGQLDSGWELLDPMQGYIYRRNRDSSCPTLR